MDQDKVEEILKKLLPFILPEPLIDVAFDVRHLAPNVFTLYTVFSAPDKWWDNLDSINKAAFMHKVKMKLRSKIKSYTGIDVEFDKDNFSIINKSNWRG
jgi:hypothetical protein